MDINIGKYICFLDFETTCWNPQKNNFEREIIKFSCSLYKMVENILFYVDEFNEFVKPTVHPKLSEFCEEFTGISQTQVDKSSIFFDVYKSNCEWIYKNVPSECELMFFSMGDWESDYIFIMETIRKNMKLDDRHKKWKNMKNKFIRSNNLREVFQKQTFEKILE
jgi:inhibitor of KinA sporulation pathway (predicted exonuclease)